MCSIKKAEVKATMLIIKTNLVIIDLLILVIKPKKKVYKDKYYNYYNSNNSEPF